jgi:hypothetical protein
MQSVMATIAVAESAAGAGAAASSAPAAVVWIRFNPCAEVHVDGEGNTVPAATASDRRAKTSLRNKHATAAKAIADAIAKARFSVAYMNYPIDVATGRPAIFRTGGSDTAEIRRATVAYCVGDMDAAAVDATQF